MWKIHTLLLLLLTNYVNDIITILIIDKDKNIFLYNLFQISFIHNLYRNILEKRQILVYNVYAI